MGFANLKELTEQTLDPLLPLRLSDRLSPKVETAEDDRAPGQPAQRVGGPSAPHARRVGEARSPARRRSIRTTPPSTPGGRDTGGVPSRNAQLVRKAFDAVNRRDAEGLIEHSAADIEMRGTGVAGEPVLYIGAAGIRGFFPYIAQSWESLQFVPEGVQER